MRLAIMWTMAKPCVLLVLRSGIDVPTHALGPGTRVPMLPMAASSAHAGHGITLLALGIYVGMHRDGSFIRSLFR